MKNTHDKGCICPGCMTWDAFDNIYIDFAMEYSQQMLTYTLATESFSNFPTNMPPHIIVPIIAKRHKILHDEMKQRGSVPDFSIPDGAEDELLHYANMPLTPEQKRIRCAFEGVYALARYGKKIPEMEFPDFRRALICQNIVIICSFAEGFLSNTIRFLCGICSGPYKAWKEKQGNKLIGMSNSDKIEKYVFEMGFGSFEKKTERIEAEFGIQVSASAAERKKVNELFLLRNCIVHNAGRLSKAYKESGMVPDHLNVGDEIDLTDQIVEELIDTLIDVATAIYRSISLQILKKPVERLMFGAHRNIKE